MEQIKQFVCEDNADRPLAEDEYRVRVDYNMPRDMSVLEAEFSKEGVSNLFTRNYTWQPHSSRALIDQTPGERIMLVKHFNRKIWYPEACAEMDELGYLAATHLEAYAFAKTVPELQRQFIIVALGSSTASGDSRYVAMLGGNSVRRTLGRCWYGNDWPYGCGGRTLSEERLLFVRK